MNDLTELRAALVDIECREREVAAETRPIRDAFNSTMAPFILRQRALDDERDSLLEQHNTYVLGICEGCSVRILGDDRYSTLGDGGYLCLECSPTWDEALEHLTGEPEMFAPDIGLAKAMIALGRGKEKVV